MATLYLEMAEGYTPEGTANRGKEVSLQKKKPLVKCMGCEGTKYTDRRFPMNNVDAIRLEQFRQFKEEIRGSTEYLVPYSLRKGLCSEASCSLQDQGNHVE